jgi:hypothetical protein
MMGAVTIDKTLSKMLILWEALKTVDKPCLTKQIVTDQIYMATEQKKILQCDAALKRANISALLFSPNLSFF